MVEFFEANTALKFDLGPQFSDYHPDAPGALTGGRSIVASASTRVNSGRGEAPARAAAGADFVGMMIGSQREQLLHFFNVTRYGEIGRLMSACCSPVPARPGAARRAMRSPTATRSWPGCEIAFDKGVSIWTSAPAVEILHRGRAHQGRDSRPGRRAHAGDGPARRRARGGRVPQDVARRKALFPHARRGPSTGRPPRPRTRATASGGRGDGAGTRSPATRTRRGCPVSMVAAPRRHARDVSALHRPRQAGVIAVLRDGRRFVNEANSYHDFVQAMVAATPAGEAPAAW